MNLPTYNLLYFKNLLDIAFIRFFLEHNDCFIKENDKYILVKDFSLLKIEKFFKTTIEKILDEIVKPYDLINSPCLYFIIGACLPKNNFLLKYKEGYFPSKLESLIYGKYLIKYLLKEKDILIDIIKFNEVCMNVFNSYFTKLTFSKKYKNVIFISNNNLDCYSLFKIIKCLYGKLNCKNLYAEYFSDIQSPIIAINDMIDKYINNKVKANNDIEFKKIYLEIKQFLEFRTNQIRK